MDIRTLQNGELIGAGILRIKSIPGIATLTDEPNSSAANERVIATYKKDMNGLLMEVYQHYKELTVANGGVGQDIALETLWLTTPVQNQPYKANITLYLIIRSIHSDGERVQHVVQALLDICRSVLDLAHYEFAECPYEEFATSFAQVKNDKINAIVKEERLEDLQNGYIPICYAYDLLPGGNQDLSRIVNILTAYPCCALSFQLIPTYYTAEESSELNRLSQMLGTLIRGVNSGSIGNVSISLAKKQAGVYSYYSENRDKALFNFNILVYGDTDAVSNISSRVVGQLNASAMGTANLRYVTLSRQEVDKENNFFPLPWAVNEMLLHRDRNPNFWNNDYVSPQLYRFPYIITSEEASDFFRFPIGTDRVSAGLVVNETGKSNKTYSKNIINSGDIALGVLKSSSGNDTIGLSLQDLAKHMLVVGTPGSGKTTFSVGLLDRLWKEHHIPFLVIEPAKNEYRALIQSIPELQVFTPGKNFISPFVFNPFVPPRNVRLETYKSTLKTAFAAGVSMSTPLDKIFEESINNCYSDFRWLDTYTVADKGRIFNISDFIKCFQETFDAIGYTGDAKNIGRAGVVRLKSLINLFDNYFSIPIEDILTKPTIIELAAIENNDQKALIIALLLLSILAYVNANYVGEGGLKNFILLEEAHVLLDASSNGSEGAANPAAIAQGLVKRMLAEIRSYGVGLAIADQSPRKVGIDIVALTDIKVAFRLVESQDKQILADSTGMSDVQTMRLAKLKPGEAFLFFNKLEEPEEIKTPDYRLQNQISISLSDDGIRQLSTYWKEKQDKLRPYPECRQTPYCTKTCDYARRVLAKEVARRIFIRHFKPDDKSIDPLATVIKTLPALIKAELNDEPFSVELLSCVKAHLFRRVKYETKIQVSESVINKSLSAILK